MKSNKIVFVCVLIGTLAFNLLFWKEKLGLNVLFFDLLIVAMTFRIRPKLYLNKTALITASGTLLAAAFILTNNSLFSKIMHLLSMISFIGFAHAKSLSFIGDAFYVGCASIIEAPLKIFTNSKGTSLEQAQVQPIRKWARLSIIPTVILLVFYTIYANANPQFARISTDFWNGFVELVLPDISMARVVFFVIGFLLVAGMLWRSVYFSNYEKSPVEENLQRSRGQGSHNLLQFKTLSLKQEYQKALLVIISLNILLFLVNLVDIYYVWLGAAEVTPDNLSNYVHEGTSLLIIAILLAMVVIVYYFRKNLNFYPGNQFLRIGAYAWIFQNVILAISVAIRNVRYIDHFGLAYKRMGVFIFLVMVFIGLITMYFKVKEKRTLYYLLHRNSWALYLVLITLSIINWDVMITKYNISMDTKSTIDIHYLTNGLSDKNIYILHEYQEALEKLATSERGFQKMLEDKVRRFESVQQNYTWLSWNLADARNKKYSNVRR